MQISDVIAVVQSQLPTAADSYTLTCWFDDDGPQVTIYKQDYTGSVGLYDFNMTGKPGRTYRYFKGEPLFSFGDGLSLTEFDVKCSAAVTAAGSSPGTTTSAQSLESHDGLGSSTVECNVSNRGAIAGDEVLLLFTAFEGAWPSAEKPKASLIDFARVTVAPGGSEKVSFSVAHESLSLITAAGDRVVPAGAHALYVKSGSTAAGSFGLAAGTVDVASPVTIDTVPRPPAWPTA